MWRLVDRIAYEEMSESVRNPYWLAHRTLYDSGSTNVSWYAFLLGLLQDLRVSPAPHAMGSPGPARPVHDQRGMAAQTSLGDETRGHPLCAVALSPTLLYFQRHAGPVRLEVHTASHRIVLLVSFPCARLARGWSCRPPSGRWPWSLRWPTLPSACCCSLGNRLPRRSPPILAPTDIVDLCRQSAHRRSRLRAPVRRLRAFLRDPSILYQGAFRGGSEGFNTSLTFILANLSQTFREFFLKGESYYFTDLPYVEFLRSTGGHFGGIGNPCVRASRPPTQAPAAAWAGLAHDSHDLGNKCHGHQSSWSSSTNTGAGSFLRPLRPGLARVRAWPNSHVAGSRTRRRVAASALAPPVCISGERRPHPRGWVSTARGQACRVPARTDCKGGAGTNPAPLFEPERLQLPLSRSLCRGRRRLPVEPSALPAHTRLRTPRRIASSACRRTCGDELLLH